MAVARRKKDSADIYSRQLRGEARRPSNVVRLLTLTEVMTGWRLSASSVYLASSEGNLRAVQRPGRQRYYLRDEVEVVFGPPVVDPDDGPTNGRQATSDERLSDCYTHLAFDFGHDPRPTPLSGLRRAS